MFRAAALLVCDEVTVLESHELWVVVLYVSCVLFCCGIVLYQEQLRYLYKLWNAD